MRHVRSPLLAPRFPHGHPVASHHLTVHLVLAVPHALHMGRAGLSRRRLGLERLLEIRHVRRHAIGENRPGTEGKEG